MIRLREIALPPDHTPEQLRQEAARLLKLPASQIESLKIVRRSVDARKKPQVRWVYTLDVSLRGRESAILKHSGCKRASLAQDPVYHPPAPRPRRGKRPVVVGFGPAGMFAALILAQAGWEPLVLERGEEARVRRDKVEHFFQTGQLDPRSNVQFGEGGAGTFSDGKLNTGVNNPRIRWVLEQFAAAGAGEEILYDAKPHVGTDVLVTVVENLRRKIQALGGEVRFRSQVTGLRCTQGRLTGLTLETGEQVDCDRVLFAIGHSARDTFAMLLDSQVPLEPKAFSLGVRLEHRQRDIDLAQYGGYFPTLPPADYKLVRHLPQGTVYTFCMCPGGQVVAAASEPGRVVTNGMSCRARDGENANAALLVTVEPREFPQPGPLGGIAWQRQIEEAAYRAGGGGYWAPAQLVGDFLADRPSRGPGKVRPTYRPGVRWTNLAEVLPEKITGALRQALPLLEGSLAGFADPEAVLTAPETRSSSPVRILRGPDRQSPLRGLYPVGEGAGYAGGIMSAAVDGILSAEALITEREESWDDGK